MADESRFCESRCIPSGVAPAARRDVNAQDVGSIPREETGQVALAAAGVRDLEAGNVVRETEQTAGESQDRRRPGVPLRTGLT